MNPFHLYPQHPDAHPDRPWWRPLTTPISHTRGWERSDGRFAAVPDNDEWSSWDDECADTDPLLCEHDTIDPLPCPPPLCGQVWAWNRPIRHQAMVVSIYERTDGVPVVTFAGAESALGDGAEWPPVGAVLVAGPGAPWAPPGWTP